MAATLYQIWQHHHKGDFAAGVRLLVEHNPGAVTRNTIARLQKLVFTGEPANDYERGKLSDALQKIHIPEEGLGIRDAGLGGVEPSVDSSIPNSQSPNPQSPNPPIPNPPIHNPQSTIPESHNPESPIPNPQSPNPQSSPLAKSLHKEHAHIHALMVTAKTDAERARYAKDIMERIIPALDAEYDRLRAAAAHADSQDTAAAEDGEDGIVEIGRPILNRADAATLKKLQSVRSRISVLKKKIPGEKDAKRKEKLQAELTQKQAEKDRLEKELS